MPHALKGFGVAASFAGWALGVWLDVGPANLLWLLASVVMCVWLACLVRCSPERATSMELGSETDSAEA